MARAGRGLTARGFLGLGANVGDRRAELQAAVDALPGHGVAVVRSSSVYETDPVGAIVDQPAFLNACVEIETALGPHDLLAAAKAVERARGRELEGAGYVPGGPRTIDVDVLLLGARTYAGERLRLPHPLLLGRRFVLIPLLELDLALATPDGTRLADALVWLPLDEGVRRAGPALKAPPR